VIEDSLNWLRSTLDDLGIPHDHGGSSRGATRA
jgi:hypothetical protein